MVIDRRSALTGLAAIAAVAMRSPVGAETKSSGGKLDVMFAASRRSLDGHYSTALLNLQGREIRSVDLPARGHDAAFCKVTGRCVVFARRPGNFAIIFTADSRQVPIMISTPEDRHFYGHGAFSRDGRLLYATENDFEAGRGVIGIYDATDQFRRLGEFPSYGAGPHDMALLRRTNVLVIANGGQKEHPDIGDGRRVLNASEIETSLVYVDLANGDLIERQDLARGTTISLRHLDIGIDDTVILGAQIQAPTALASPLVFHHQRQSTLATIDLPLSARTSLAGYVSSIAVDQSGEVAAVTSSRGGVAILLDVRYGKVLQQFAARDVSGVAPKLEPREYVMACGSGNLLDISSRTGIVGTQKTDWSWDNHIARSGD
jgi:hypothetical protein